MNFELYFKNRYKDKIDEYMYEYIHREDFETSIKKLYIENDQEMTLYVYATIYVDYYEYQDIENKKCLTIKCFVDLENENNFEVIEIVEYEKPIIKNYTLDSQSLLPYIPNDKYDELANEIINHYFTKTELCNYIDAKTLAKKLSTSKKKKPEKTIDFGIGKIVVGQTANTVISTTPKKLGKTTVTLNSNGPSSDYTLGHYGYTVGPSNVDIFSTSTYKNTTYKSSLGVEDKYYYSRLGIDIKADKDLSLDTYGKLYLRQEVVDVALIVIPAFGEITVLAKDGATAIKTAKEIAKQLAKRSILIPVGGSG